MEETMRRFSFTLPPELVEKVDKVADELEMNRSQVVREALSHWLHHSVVGNEWSDFSGVAIVTYSYNHKDVRILQALMESQHKYESLITSTTHVHMDTTRCFELNICHGDMSTIREFGNQIRKIKGIEAFFIYFSH